MIKKLVIATIAVALLAAPALAGTYRNDAAYPIIVKNSSGQPQSLRPGQTIQTVYVPSDTGMPRFSHLI